jgi:hypothetical protein
MSCTCNRLLPHLSNRRACTLLNFVVLMAILVAVLCRRLPHNECLLSSSKAPSPSLEFCFAIKSKAYSSAVFSCALDKLSPVSSALSDDMSQNSRRFVVVLKLNMRTHLERLCARGLDDMHVVTQSFSLTLYHADLTMKVT